MRLEGTVWGGPALTPLRETNRDPGQLAERCMTHSSLLHCIYNKLIVDRTDQSIAQKKDCQYIIMEKTDFSNLV